MYVHYTLKKLDLEEVLAVTWCKGWVSPSNATSPVFVRNLQAFTINLELLSVFCSLKDAMLVSVLRPHHIDGERLCETFPPP